MTGKQRSTPACFDRIERQLLPADRPLDPLARRNREQRVMGDQDARDLRIGAREALADELDLALR